MSLWQPDATPPPHRLGPAGVLLALVRLIILATVIYSLLVVLLLVRLIEIPLHSRRFTSAIVQLACKVSLRVLGMKVSVRGRAMRHDGAVISNHASWLDIFSLNAVMRVSFVSKAEVSAWPVIGLIARGAGTVFIERRQSHAKKHMSQFQARLLSGDRLLFFPEGTSTDSRRVLDFKSTLFAAFFDPGLADRMWIQPATLVYHAPAGKDARFYGWWGDMAFGPHFFSTLGVRRNGRIEVLLHDPVRVADFPDRKTLAQYCEQVVRRGLTEAIGAPEG